MLAIAFATVGTAAIYVVAGWTLQKDRAETHKLLLETANLISLQVDPAMLADFQSASQVGTPLYDQLTRKLRQAMNASPKISDVFAVRCSPKKLTTVLWANPPAEGSPVFQPFNEADATLATVVQSGRPGIEELNNRLRAYVPLVQPNGTIDTALVVDQPLGPILTREAGFWKLVTAANVLVLVLSALFAGLIAQRLSLSQPQTTARFQTRRNRWILRSGILEVILLGVACTVMVVGIAGHLGAASDAEKAAGLARQLDACQRLRDRLDRILIRNSINKADLVVLARYAENANLDSASSEISAVSDIMDDPQFEWRPFIGRVLRMVSRETTANGNLRTTLDALKERNESLLAYFGIAACLTLAALILIRAASRQQQELSDAVDESTQHKQTYSQLVDQLPIGLFTFRGGSCHLTNAEWNRQTERSDNESADDAFSRALHPDDQKRVHARLQQQQELKKPFTLDYRIVDSGGRSRTFECRGVPVLDDDGNLKHLLAFSADITQLETDRREIESKNEQLADANQELQASLAAMVHLLVKAVEAKDVYTAGHSDRVTQYSLRIGDTLGLSESDLRTLKMGAQIHDVGKIGVPDAILNKPGFLTDDEYEFVRAHPVIGHEMIRDIPQFAECACIVRWHHERLDGSGYPDGLRGDEIPLMVRISSVADVFDAITSVRAYKKGKSIEAALAEMRIDANRGLLDLQIVEILADIVLREGMLPQVELQLPMQEIAS